MMKHFHHVILAVLTLLAALPLSGCDTAQEYVEEREVEVVVQAGAGGILLTEPDLEYSVPEITLYDSEGELLASYADSDMVARGEGGTKRCFKCTCDCSVCVDCEEITCP